MEEAELKICPNCKREIPVVNYTIHTVHCARNIRICPVCKEPVPQQELQDHHEKFHKLLPCKKCGESVCGTDLEDHIRDSCAHTIKSCRYCELELPRRELPAHENYCGVRTEQCSDCKEWVMIKYRQLHLDSNHGFLRLDDDPVPQPKKEMPKLNVISRVVLASGSNTNGLQNNPIRVNRPIGNRPIAPIPMSPVMDHNRPCGVTNGFHGQLNNVQFPKTTIRYLGNGNPSDPQPGTSGPNNTPRRNIPDLISLNDCAASGSGVSQEVKKVPLKRTNDQPQINTAVHAVDKVNKELPLSRGAVKKRPAPPPPARAPPPDPRRDLAYHSALHRHQQEERRREEQSAHNVARGLPPVLSPAAKLEKLRKMDALQNREVDDKDYKNRLQGRVWMSTDAALPTGHRLGSRSPEKSPDLENRRNEFKDLKPMTTQEFMERFKELGLNMPPASLLSGGSGEPQERTNANGSDRFSEIKSSLRELRRGLNEVTAPYNSNLNAASNNTEGARCMSRSPLSPPSPEGEAEAEVDVDVDVRLPCEFCDAAVPAHHLVQHQTGCRPDLAQLRPRSVSPALPLARAPPPLARAPPPPVWAPPPPLRAPPPEPLEQPVIPCEFCMESLPVYLITEHQERCRNESDLLY